MSAPENPPPINARRARQGQRGRHIVLILVVSTLLGAAVLFGNWFMRADEMATTELNNARQAEDVAPFESPVPANVTQQTGPQDERAPQPAR